MQNLIVSNLEGLALQYAISRARDVLFAIPSNWISVGAAHAAEDLQALNFNVALVPINLFVLKEVNSPEADQELGMFIQEGPEDEHFVYDVNFKDNSQVQVVNSKFLKNIQLISNN